MGRGWRGGIVKEGICVYMCVGMSNNRTERCNEQRQRIKRNYFSFYLVVFVGKYMYMCVYVCVYMYMVVGGCVELLWGRVLCDILSCCSYCGFVFEKSNDHFCFLESFFFFGSFFFL